MVIQDISKFVNVSLKQSDSMRVSDSFVQPKVGKTVCEVAGGKISFKILKICLVAHV